LEKAPKGVRIAEIILGAITIGLSGFVLSNPDATTLFFIMLLGISLILTGISRIIVGAVVKGTPGSFKAISVGTGILSIIGGIFALYNPITAVATLIWIVSIFILIHGLGLIGSGLLSKEMSNAYRFGGIVLGGIAVAFASILLVYPGLALIMMIVFLSIGLLFNGIASIVSGITGTQIRQIREK